jgi:hypothetical protein
MHMTHNDSVEKRLEEWGDVDGEGKARDESGTMGKGKAPRPHVGRDSVPGGHIGETLAAGQEKP